MERLYLEVVEDASNLLRNLPSEKETLITVLRNVETQCLKVGIFVSDDVNELASIKPTKRNENPNSGFLSAEVKKNFFVPISVSEELRYLAHSSRYQLSPPGSYEHFTPQLVSTPKHTDKKRDFFHDESLFHLNHHEPNHSRSHIWMVRFLRYLSISGFQRLKIIKKRVILSTNVL